jgi:indolepyruvate decarboxylase
MYVSSFLIERLENAGVKHVFGLPGDYVLDFYKELWDNKNIEVINNTDENHSGFAADAYSRVHGIGCVAVTYNVGASKVINAVQCAYAERSPLIIISGAPGMDERQEGMLLHHMVGSFNSQKEMFENITCASVVLDNPATAGYEIDKAMEALHHYKRPIYIELPRDIAKKSISYDVYKQGTPTAPDTDPENLQEALEEIMSWVETAKNPMILAGVEVSRYDLGEKLVRFAEKTNIPVATTLLSKSVINERHPLFAGIYSGASSDELTKSLVEESDCLLMFGVMLTDMTLCFKPDKFKKRQVVAASVSGLQVKSHSYTEVQFDDFCEALFKLNFGKKDLLVSLPEQEEKTKFVPVEGDDPLTTKRLFEYIDSILDKDMAIVADIGDSLFGAADLTVHHRNHFLSPAFYTSMGSAIPGALGVQTAKPDVRPIVIVGDGAFQMSCLELSTIVDRGLNPIVFVLNNDGYTTERFLLDGDFNNLRKWNYHDVTTLINGGEARQCATESQLFESVQEALASKELFVLNVEVARDDVSQGLTRMTEALSKKI